MTAAKLDVWPEGGVRQVVRPHYQQPHSLRSHVGSIANNRAQWLAYGAALNELKAQYPGKQDIRAFGEAVTAAKLDVWPTEGICDSSAHIDINRHIRTAAQWAASLTPAELDAYITAHPTRKITRDGGFRGLHAGLDKWPENVQGQVGLVEIKSHIRTAAMWAAGLDKWPEGYCNNLLQYEINRPTRAPQLFIRPETHPGTHPAVKYPCRESWLSH